MKIIVNVGRTYFSWVRNVLYVSRVSLNMVVGGVHKSIINRFICVWMGVLGCFIPSRSGSWVGRWRGVRSMALMMTLTRRFIRTRLLLATQLIKQQAFQQSTTTWTKHSTTQSHPPKIKIKLIMCIMVTLIFLRLIVITMVLLMLIINIRESIKIIN